MKAETHSISDVLSKNATSFYIPPFQRAYAWGESEIKRYFEDVNRIVDSLLDQNQQDKQQHFFGCLVIKEESFGFSSRSIVVDGQQRLTTTLLFLIALRDLEENQKNKDLITNTYLLNETSGFQDKIKLKQVTKDWETYRLLVKGEYKVSNDVLSKGYDIFRTLILKQSTTRKEVNLNLYIEAIKRMNVAVIFLNERPHMGEDPQIIFETLNSLGKPLTLSDLVRNFVLLKLNSDEQSKVYEQIWYPMVELELGEFASHFFRHFLQYKLVTPIKVVGDNNTKEIYQIFKQFVDREYSDSQSFVNDIVKYVQPFTWIIRDFYKETITSIISNDFTIKELLRNIFHDIKTDPFQPLVLGLLKHYIDSQLEQSVKDNILIESLEAIRTYLIRRRLMKLSQAENKSIVLLSSRLDEIMENHVSMLSLLSSQSYILRMPNDTEISCHLKSMLFYKDAGKYAKLILGKMEESQTKVAVDFRNTDITIEHIMPQKLNNEWIEELGEGAELIHEEYIHNLGNLILTEFNSEMGNRAFEQKKVMLSKSSLSYRLHINNVERWNKKAILNHQGTMVDLFLKTFKVPDNYKYASNWNEGQLDVTEFSPLDDDAGEIAEGRKPIRLKVKSEIHNVKYWVDVYLLFLKYMRFYSDYQFNSILSDQEKLLKKHNSIVTQEMYLNIVGKNPDLERRYKTLDGKFLYQAKDTDEKTLLVHINISASGFMSRISNIMKKFGMSRDQVTIQL